MFRSISPHVLRMRDWSSTEPLAKFLSEPHEALRELSSADEASLKARSADLSENRASISRA